MPDFPPLAHPTGLPAAEGLLPALLDLLPTGVVYYAPVHDAAGQVIDFVFAYLNPAAQHLLALPAQPTATFSQQFPAGLADGSLARHRAAWLAAGEPATFVCSSPSGPGAPPVRVLARRQGAGLLALLNFADEAAGQELRASQARERQARAETEARRAGLQRGLEQAPVAIAMLEGPAHVIGFANAKMAQLWGRPMGPLLGQPHFVALPDLAGQGFEDVFAGVFRTGQPRYFQERPVTVDRGGRPYAGYFNIAYEPIIDGTNRITGIMAFAYDVTEQVLARQQLATQQAELLAAAQRHLQAREDFYQVLEQAPTAIMLLRGPGHHIDYFNPAYGQYFPGDELLGRPVADAHPRATEHGIIALLDAVYRTGETYVGHEWPLELARDEPGQLRYFNFVYEAYREQGHIVGVSVFATEATEQVRTRRAIEAQHAAQQAELQRIFAQAPVAIAILRGPDLVIELANAAVESIWGRTAAQVLGRPYFQALPETAGQGFEQILANVLRTGQPFFVTEAPVQLPQPGQPRQGYVNFVFQPLFDEQRRATSLLAIGTEVTEQVRARQQVQQLNEELAAINEAVRATNQELNDTNTRLTRTNADLDTFVYSASHDLKSPITNVEGLLLALREHLPANALQDPLVPRLLGMMHDAVARFQQTLAHLSDVTRLQDAVLNQPIEEINLPALVEGVRLDMLPELTLADATLTVDLGACPTVRFSPKNLRSIVYNLLSNAVKYRNPARPALVQLRGHCAAGRVVLEVQDNGLGLTTEQQAELFRMFRRLHSHVPGSGVGLYMVRKMVENAGGRIAVVSQPGVGSTFTVSLPHAE